MVAERVVKYRLEAYADPGAKKAFEDMARWGVAAQEKIARARTSAASQAQRDLDREARETERFYGKQARDFEAMRRDMLRIDKAAAAEQARNRTDLARIAEKAAKDEARAVQAAMRDQQRAQALVQQSGLAAASALEQAAGGALKLGRAMVLLNVANEEDLQVVMRKLAQVQAMIDMYKGVVDIVQAGVKMWNAYRAAVLAAAAAEAAAGRVSMASAGGRVAAGAAGGVGGAAASAAGGAVGGGLAAAAAPLAAVIGAAIAGFAALTAALYIFVPSFREGMNELLGIADHSKDAAIALSQKQLAAIEAGEKARRMQSEDLQLAGANKGRAVEAALLRAGPDPSARLAALDQFAAGERATMEGERTRQAGLGDAGLDAQSFFTAMEGSLGTERQAAEQLAALDRERLSLVQEQGRARLAAADAEIAKLERARDVEQQRLDAARSNLEGAAERFGQMSPEERAASLRTFRRFQAGEELSTEERKRLRGIGFADEARQLDIAAARSGGFGEIEAVLGKRVSAAQQALAKVELELRTKNEFRIQIEADTQKMAQAIAEELASLQDAIIENAQKGLRTERDRQRNEELTRAAADESAKAFE